MLTSSSIELPLLELTVIEVEPRHLHRLETLLAAAEVELNPSEGLCGLHKYHCRCEHMKSEDEQTKSEQMSGLRKYKQIWKMSCWVCACEY